MVNTADEGLRLVDISLVLWQYIFEKRLWPARARSPAMLQYEQNQIWTALEPDIASETAVLLSRPPQPLREHPPKRKTFCILLSRRKLSACMCLDRFCGICGGIPETTKALTAEARYMTFEAQTFLLNKDT